MRTERAPGQRLTPRVKLDSSTTRAGARRKHGTAPPTQSTRTKNRRPAIVAVESKLVDEDTWGCYASAEETPILRLLRALKHVQNLFSRGTLQVPPRGDLHARAKIDARGERGHYTHHIVAVAGSEKERLRVAIDQIASLTDPGAYALHAKLSQR